MPGASNSSNAKMISCDQEVWLLNRIQTAMLMTRNVIASARVGADDTALEYALDGVAHGTAVAILSLLGCTCEHKNIRSYPQYHIPRRGASETQHKKESEK